MRNREVSCAELLSWDAAKMQVSNKLKKSLKLRWIIADGSRLIADGLWLMVHG